MTIIASAGMGGAAAGGSSLLGPIAIGVMAGSSILGGIANMKAAKAAKKAAELNKLAARISTEFKVQDLLDQGRRLESAQRAAAAKSGVALEGSPVEVMNDAAAQIEKQVYRTKYMGSLKEQGAQIEADAYGQMADNALLASFLGATSSVIGGASKMKDWR